MKPSTPTPASFGLTFAGSRSWENKLKDGTITTAIRQGLLNYKTSGRMVIGSSNRNWCVFVTITAVSHIKAKQVTDAYAIAAGLTGKQQWGTLQRSYWGASEVNDDSWVTVIEFELTSPPNV